MNTRPYVLQNIQISSTALLNKFLAWSQFCFGFIHLQFSLFPQKFTRFI